MRNYYYAYYTYMRKGEFIRHCKLAQVLSAFLLILSCIFFIPGITSATNYYINGTGGNNSNTGTSTGKAWKTISKANSTLVAGDTVYIMAGTYSGQIAPSNSGTSGNPITYINYQSDSVTLTSPINFDGGNLVNKSYIVIDGLRFIDSGKRWLDMRSNSHYNTIQKCYFKGANTFAGIDMFSNGTCTYIKFIDNTFIATCPSSSNSLGSGEGPFDPIYVRDGDKNHFLIQGNTFTYAAHIACSINEGATYIIVKDNTFQNKWHTGLKLGGNTPDNLVEGNTFSDSGIQDNDNRCGDAEAEHSDYQGSTRTSIIRNNTFAGRGTGAEGSFGGGWAGFANSNFDNNRIYNNVFYDKTHGINNGDSNYEKFVDNTGKNNIFNNNAVDLGLNQAGGTSNNIWKYNLIYNTIVTKNIFNIGDGAVTLSFMESNYPSTWNNNLEQDPLFTDAEGRDFTLQVSSPCIDAGDWLTTITSATGSGTSFVVADARYFMDGWGLITGDTIQLEGQTSTRTVTNVNYSTNTININSSVSWTSGDGVALAYSGSKPDIGAYEHGGTTTSDTDSPQTPSNLTATAVSSSQINLTWNACTDNIGVTGYKIFRDGIQIATSATNSYSDTGRSPLTTYTYTVSAYDAAGNESGQSSASNTTDAAGNESGQSAASSATTFLYDTTPPMTPAGIQATAISTSQINLSWNASTDDIGVTSYGIYRDGVKIATTANTTYQDTGLSPFTTYSYTVSAYDAAGNESGQSDASYTTDVAENESGQSAGSSATTFLYDTTPPTNSNSLQATAISTSQINLSWNASTDDIGVTGYGIYRDGVKIATTANTTYQDTGLSPLTTYTYTVSAYDAAGNESLQSAATYATTLLDDTTPLTTSTGLQATAISTFQINLFWNASTDNTGVTSYVIYRDGVQITTTLNTTYQDKGLSPLTTYTYTVSAYDAAGNESWQSAASYATTLFLDDTNTAY